MGSFASPFKPLCPPPPAGVSYDRACVELFDWWLVKVDPESAGRPRLAVAGFSTKKHALRLFTSAPIAKRHDTYTLETEDGITLLIHGPINDSHMRDNGFSPELSRRFLLGFPINWEHYDKIPPIADSSQGNSSLCSHQAVGNKNDLFASTGSKSISSCSLRQKKAHSDKKQRNVESKNVKVSDSSLAQSQEKHTSVASAEELKLKRTRSGRVVVPQLDRGSQKIIYDEDGFIVGVAAVDGLILSNRDCYLETPDMRNRLQR